MERIDLFATPLFAFSLDDVNELNGELSNRLRAESLRYPGVQQSNVGGWHSVQDLSRRSEGCYRAVMEIVRFHLNVVIDNLSDGTARQPRQPNSFEVHGWAMVMGDGHYTLLHNHGETHWSVVYYIDAGNADLERYPQSGMISFVDPRRGVDWIPGLDTVSNTFSIKPDTGLLLVFPGFLQHYVHPYHGTRPRICISCNVKVNVER